MLYHGVGRKRKGARVILKGEFFRNVLKVKSLSSRRGRNIATNQSGGSSTQVDTILCRRCHLKEVSDCKPVVGESVASQQRALVWRMTPVVRKTKRPKTEQKTNWWKLKKKSVV